MGVPTILLAELTPDWGDDLARQLEQRGYFVLKSHSDAEALSIVTVHSRPIHMLVAEATEQGNALAERLTAYRSHMHVLFVRVHPNNHHWPRLDTEDILSEIKNILE